MSNELKINEERLHAMQEDAQAYLNSKPERDAEWQQTLERINNMGPLSPEDKERLQKAKQELMEKYPQYFNNEELKAKLEESKNELNTMLEQQEQNTQEFNSEEHQK